MSEVVLQSPRVILTRGAIAPQICAHLIDRSLEKMSPSGVMSGGKSVVDPKFRDSATRPLPDGELDVSELEFVRRVAEIAGISGATSDKNITRYGVGGIFRPHFDPIKPTEQNPRGSRRRSTTLCYLNDGYSGGETAFPVAGVAFEGRVGDVLTFFNELDDGSQDPASLHAGMPVTEGEKWVFVLWNNDD